MSSGSTSDNCRASCTASRCPFVGESRLARTSGSVGGGGREARRRPPRDVPDGGSTAAGACHRRSAVKRVQRWRCAERRKGIDHEGSGVRRTPGHSGEGRTGCQDRASYRHPREDHEHQHLRFRPAHVRRPLLRSRPVARWATRIWGRSSRPAPQSPRSRSASTCACRSTSRAVSASSASRV